MYKSLVSFIVPVYNCEKYIKDCLNSLVKQTSTNFEIVVINDGSTDNSLQIIKEYEALYSFIHCINQENQGLSAARNNGLNVSKGEYIAFLDGDDLIATNFIEIINNHLIHKPDIIRFNYYILNADGTKIPIKEKKSDTSSLKTKILNDEVGNQVWRNVYKKTAIETFSFENGCLWEDLLWTFKPFFYSKSIIFIDDCLYYYRNNPTGISRSTKAKKTTAAIFNAYKIRLDFAKKNNINDSYDILLRKTFYSAVNSMAYQSKRSVEFKEAKQFIKNNRQKQFITTKYFIVYYLNFLMKLYIGFRDL